SPNGPGRYRPVAPRRVVLASRAGGPCSRSTCSARSACPLRSASDRSARRRTHACAGLCTPRSTLWAVELRREKSRRRPQDRVRPAQLTHFLLQFDQALGLASRGSGTVSLVDLRLHDPIPQSLGIDPELLAHTTERARPRRWIPSRLNSHPRGSLPKLVRVLPRCCHAPHPPVDSEPPPDPGRFTWSGTGSEPTVQQSRTEIRQVTRTRQFLTLQVVMTVATFTLFAVTINLIPLLLERGIDYSTAALAFGLVGAGQVIGRLGYPSLTRRTTPQHRTLVILGSRPDLGTDRSGRRHGRGPR